MTSNTEQDLQLGHHAGAPHFAPGNGEGYVSRMGLMAVTADMEHLRNHEGQESSHSEPVAAVLIGDVWNSPFRQHRWLCSSEQKE
jgi:hypothetical protein